MHLRPARPAEAPLLTELCLASKAVWGYDEPFMHACRAELTLSPADFQTSALQVAVDGGSIVGVAQVAVRGDIADLAKLFVAPAAMRAGVGKRLFDWATDDARRQGARSLTIDADPEAAGFYRRMGAVDDGVTASGSIPGRLLPRLTFRL